MYLPLRIDLSEKTLKIALEMRDKIQSEIKSENFFSNKIFSIKIFAQQKNFVGKKILGFCFCYHNRERLKCNGILYYELSLKYYKSSPLLVPQLQHVGKHAPLSLLTP